MSAFSEDLSIMTATCGQKLDNSLRAAAEIGVTDEGGTVDRGRPPSRDDGTGRLVAAEQVKRARVTVARR
jgi:hypothetical protein